jgi:uncharacterized protein YggE
MMKRKYLLIAAGVLLVACLLVPGCAATGNSRTAQQISIIPFVGAEDLARQTSIIASQQNVGLWVNGEGKAIGVPDIAIIQLGVEAQQKTVAEAQRQAADSMDKVMRVITSRGVADKDIQTRQYSISPVRRWLDKENREELIGYKVSNMVVVKIRKIDTAGGIIDAVSEAGGNTTRMTSISFTVDDPTLYYKEARGKAVADAIEKAKQITSAAGIKMGKQIYISESTVYVPQINYMRAEAAAPSPAPSTPISAGELEFRINIQIVYAID